MADPKVHFHLQLQYHSFLADPTPPCSPIPNPNPTPPASKHSSLSTTSTAEDPQSLLVAEYEILTAQLRRRIQDYEIALLRMQLRARDKELKAMLQSKHTAKAEEKIEELVVVVGRQDERIEKLVAEMELWKICALEARFMLELTYGDLSRGSKGRLKGVESRESGSVVDV